MADETATLRRVTPEDINAERVRAPAEWAGIPDVAVEAGLCSLDHVRTEVLQYVLRLRAHQDSMSLLLVYR